MGEVILEWPRKLQDHTTKHRLHLLEHNKNDKATTKKVFETLISIFGLFKDTNNRIHCDKLIIEITVT